MTSVSISRWDMAEASRQLREDGYVVLEGALDPDQLGRMRADLEADLDGLPFGRNDFEGFRTRRSYSLLARVPSMAEIVEHPAVMQLADELLLPNFLLSALLAIDIHPGETAQGLHFDDTFYVIPRPRPPVGISTIWAFDDFTEENGATEIVPGSHAWGDRVPTGGEATPVCMPAGSVVVFASTLWHRGGANRSSGRRLAVTAQYCEPWARQQEQMMLAVPPERVRSYSDRVRSMLGYSIHPPFMGHVGSLHPLRLVDPAYGGR